MVSASSRPGSRRCTWRSTSPGRATRPSASSTSRSPRRDGTEPTSRMTPSSTSRSAASAPSRRAPRISRRLIGAAPSVAGAAEGWQGRGRGLAGEQVVEHRHAHRDTGRDLVEHDGLGRRRRPRARSRGRGSSGRGGARARRRCGPRGGRAGRGSTRSRRCTRAPSGSSRRSSARAGRAASSPRRPGRRRRAPRRGRQLVAKPSAALQALMPLGMSVGGATTRDPRAERLEGDDVAAERPGSA